MLQVKTLATHKMQPDNFQEGLHFYHSLSSNDKTPNMETYGNQYWNFNFHANQNLLTNNSSFYPLEVSEITINTPEARALTALNNHKEAERRRRERINSHLDRLRTLLSCNSKTDKASLLAKAVQHVKELKQQTSEITTPETFPSETDEITVLSIDNNNNENSADGRLLIKASLCCEDRSDLIPELIETLKRLRLSPIRAEMVTIGGRIRNVIILAGDDHEKNHGCSSAGHESVLFLRDALESLVHRSRYGSGEWPKRRRVCYPRMNS